MKLVIAINSFFLTNMKTSISRHHLGFSLMELLIVTSIIGIMATLVTLSWGHASQKATEMKDRRNAQEIASLAAIANAAGAPFIVPNDKKATIEKLAAGARPSSGVFKNREFKLPPIGTTGIEGAMHYLALKGTELVYQQNNSQGNPSQGGSTLSEASR